MRFWLFLILKSMRWKGIEKGVTSRARPRSGDQAKRSGFGFDRDVGVEARGFALDVMIHERLPFVVEGDTTEVQQRLRAG